MIKDGSLCKEALTHTSFFSYCFLTKQIFFLPCNNLGLPYLASTCFSKLLAACVPSQQPQVFKHKANMWIGKHAIFKRVDMAKEHVWVTRVTSHCGVKVKTVNP